MTEKTVCRLADGRIRSGKAVKVAICFSAYFALFFLVALHQPIGTILDGSAPALERASAESEFRYALSHFLAPLAFGVLCMLLHSLIVLQRHAGASSDQAGLDLVPRLEPLVESSVPVARVPVLVE